MNHNLQKLVMQIEFKIGSTLSNMLLKIVIVIFKIPSTKYQILITHLIKWKKNANFCLYSDNEVDTFSLSQFGLFALQHRGQEACGVSVASKK